MERWSGRVALVTGASSGIGACIAEGLVKCGLRVVGCARRVDRIQLLADSLSNESGKLYPVKCDLTEEEDIVEMFRIIEDHEELGRLDICINNAGISFFKGLTEESMANWRRMMDVNVLGPCLCTQKSIELMRRKGVNDGQIIILNSVAGHVVVPFKCTRFYSATKFALRALTEGWRQELKELNTSIRISQICPGFVESDFWDTMFTGAEEFGNKIKPNSGLKASDIWDTVLHIITAPSHVEINDVVLRPTNQLL